MQLRISKIQQCSIILFLGFYLISYRYLTLQTGVLSLMAIYGLAYFWLKHRLILPANLVYISLMIGLTYIITELFSYFPRDTFYILQELKILPLFLLPMFFEALFKQFRLDYLEQRQAMVSTTKAYIILILCINMYYNVMMGAARYTGPYEYSISLAYSLVFLSIAFFHELSIKWKIFITINCFLLGSTMAFALLTLSWVVLLRHFFSKQWQVSWLTKLVLTIPAIMVVLWYLSMRGRGDILQEFSTTDRVQVIQAAIDYAKTYFGTIDVLFGFGIGRELAGFIEITSEEYPVVFHWIIKDFTGGGELLYSYVFHNEFVRLFYNFGIFGPVVTFYLLYRSLNTITFLVVLMASTTNSVVYSFITIFVVALLMYLHKADKQFKRNTLTVRHQVTQPTPTMATS